MSASFWVRLAALPGLAPSLGAAGAQVLSQGVAHYGKTYAELSSLWWE